MPQKKGGIMVILSSPSGAGKTTLVKLLTKNNNNFYISVSHTTRKPRPNEFDGKDYFFVSDAEFKRLVNLNKHIESLFREKSKDLSNNKEFKINDER